MPVQFCQRGELALGLAVEGRLDVVVVQRHATACRRGRSCARQTEPSDVADRRSRSPLVQPSIQVSIDAAALVVRVAFHILHGDVVGRGEAPDRALPGTVGLAGVDLIDAPVVGLAPLEVAGVEGRAGLLALVERALGVRRRDGGFVRAEIDIVLLGLLAGTPAQGQRLGRIDGAVGGTRRRTPAAAGRAYPSTYWPLITAWVVIGPPCQETARLSPPVPSLCRASI